jgi:hypothetical protein
LPGKIPKHLPSTDQAIRSYAENTLMTSYSFTLTFDDSEIGVVADALDQYKTFCAQRSKLGSEYTFTRVLEFIARSIERDMGHKTTSCLPAAALALLSCVSAAQACSILDMEGPENKFKKSDTLLLAQPLTMTREPLPDGSGQWPRDYRQHVV